MQLTNRSIGSLINDAYTYDASGNITVKGADSYTLDALYRITADGTDSYSYDAIGNRTAKNSDVYIYPSTSSKLSSIASSNLTTDAAGNITADISRTYVIDAAGHVKEVKIGGSTVGAYVYDADNLRTQKTAGTNVTHYVYGMGGKLYGEYDTSGNMVREYVYLNGQPLAQVDSGEVLSYLHTDHLGTPRYATNTSGSQVWAWVSDAFGNGAPTGAATVNLRFAGQYWDDESDLHYNWNRYYDPATGRYITSDPIGLAGGLNTYGYALANPVMYIDPEGLKSIIMTVPARQTRSVRASRAAAQRVQIQARARQIAVAQARQRAIEAGRKMTREEEQALVEEIYQILVKIIEIAEAEGRTANICLEKSCPPSAPQCKIGGGGDPEEPVLSAPAKRGEIPPIFDKKGCHCKSWLRNSIF